MKFALKNNTGYRIEILMRGAGYRFLQEEVKDNESSFVRPISFNHYPRFHVYLRCDKETKEIFFNLHLDQKKPIYPVRKFLTSNGVYKGVRAHSADYEGEILENEALRIKNFFLKNE